MKIRHDVSIIALVIFMTVSVPYSQYQIAEPPRPGPGPTDPSPKPPGPQPSPMPKPNEHIVPGAGWWELDR